MSEFWLQVGIRALVGLPFEAFIFWLGMRFERNLWKKDRRG